MKRWFVAVGAVALLFFPCMSHAETIRNFSVDLRVDADRTVHATEIIEDDTGAETRTGFVRFIPATTGYNGVIHSRHVTVESVTRNGQAVPFQTVNVDGYVQVIISANDEVSGKQEYRISYQEMRAIDRVAGHDALDWEVVGTNWDVPIERATVHVSFPDGSSPDQIESACVVGIGLIVDPDCHRTTGSSDITLQMRRVLLPEEGMRVAFDIPTGVISDSSMLYRVWYSIQDHAPFVFPLSAFSIMLLAWWLKGRDPKFGLIPVISSPPDDLSPEVLAAMLNENEPPAHATEVYEKMFDADPVTTRGAYTLIGLILTIILYAFLGSSGVGVVSAVATGVIIVIFGWFMPRRTVEGTKMLVRILGFKKFLSQKQSPKEFERLLPYAIALGVEKECRSSRASGASE